MFLMAPLLFGLLAASIPVIIHLLHRQRTTPLRWGAMQFLLETPLQMKRRRHVEHWLLMLLRVLGLAALAFLLARPLWIHGQYNPLASRLPVDVAVVLDRSLSMGRLAGGEPLFKQAARTVDRVADLLRASDSLSVVLAEHHPRVLTPLPAAPADLPRLREQLNQMQPGLSDGSIPDAVQVARETIDRGRNIRKIILVASDAQRTSWQPGNDTAWRLAAGAPPGAANRDLSVHELAFSPNSDASDVSVNSLSTQPNLIGVGLPAQITATLSNSGPKEVGPSSVRLSVNGKPIDPPRQVPALAAGASTTIRFDYTFTAAGSNWIKVESDVADALPADNEAVAAVNVWQKLPVLIIDGQVTHAGAFKSSQFLRSAMQPVDRSDESSTLVQPQVVSVSESAGLTLDDFYVVIVNDCPRLPTAIQDKLADYARSGHGVWLIFGPRTESSFISEQLGRAGIFAASLNGSAPHDDVKPQPLQLKDPQNPMVSLLAASRHDALADAVTEKWWSMQPADPETETILTLSSGDPLVMERPMGRNGGRIAVWCTSVEGQWNNWPLVPGFVPLVNETIFHLSSGQTRGLENRTLEAGEPLLWTAPAAQAVQAVDVTLPDGSVDGNKTPTLANNRYEFRFNDAFAPGLYALRFTPTEVKPQPIFYGVGIDRRELDGQTLSGKERQHLADIGCLDEAGAISLDDLPAIIRKENRGADLWKWLALIVLLNLLAESYLTYRLINAQKKVQIA